MMLNSLPARIFFLKLTVVIGVVYVIVGGFSITIGMHDFKPAYDELTAMQAMAEAAAAAAAEAGATTTTTKEPSATEASAAPIQPPPEVKMLIGKVDDGMFKMKVGGVMLVNGFIMIIACIIVFFCSIKPKLEAENGGRSMQYNVVTMSGHDDSKA